MSQIPPNDNPYLAKAVPEKPAVGKPDSWGEPVRTSGKAIASLVFSLLSFVSCGIGGVVGLILGFMGHSDIKTSQGRLTGSGFATSGIVIALVSFAMIVIAMPVALLLPAINAAREAARRNGCLSNTRQLALGASFHESTMKRYPLGSDAIGPFVGDDAAVPGTSAGNTAAGYSWQVKVLPYIEESHVYDEIADSSQMMTVPAFDPSVTARGQHPSQLTMPYLRCPSFSGEPIAMAVEYAGGIGKVAQGNYVGLPGTHLKADGTLEENGILVSKWSGTDQGDRGLKIADIGDGISKTVLLCESREQNYASWYDGQATWVTALRTDINENNLTTGPDGFPQAAMDAAALNYGPDSYDPALAYLPAARYPGQQSREWGPSSMHGGGVVLHAFADAHAQSISSDIDATTYMQMITRNGGEPTNPNDF